MATIAAVIITLNEERNIGRCIDSIKPVADEILVLDAFSKDATISICKEKSVKYIQREWKGYSNAKNFANKQVLAKYILSIDADEALSKELQQSILKAKENGFEGVYEMNRLTNYCGKWIKHCGWYPDKKTRLFPKKGAQWVGEYVHEELQFDQQQNTHFLKGDLLHYSYYTVDEHKQRIEKYTQLAAEKLAEKGKKGDTAKGTLKGVIRFLKMYFLKGGILDGRAGFTICVLSAKAVYLRYKKLSALLQA